MNVSGNHFILLQGAFMSYGEIIFTSSNITGSTKRAPPPLVGAANDASGGGGGGAAAPTRKSNFDQDQCCTIQTFTKDLLAAGGAALKAATAPSPKYSLPAVYVSQQCRVVIDDTPKCCFLDAAGSRIVLVLQTGLLQASHSLCAVIPLLWLGLQHVSLVTVDALWCGVVWCGGVWFIVLCTG